MGQCPECDRELGSQATICFVCGTLLETEGEATSSSLLDAGSDAVERLRRLAEERSDQNLALWRTARRRLGDQLSDLRGRSTDKLPSLLAFLHTDDLVRWLDAAYTGSKTEYDRALDAAFVAKQRAGELGYSAGQHRLFDGGHTIAGSFERARDAVQGDGALTETVEWAQAYMNDLTTPAGMPLTTLDPTDFDRWASAISETVPGLDQQYLFDLLNFDAMELIATEIAVVGVLFALSDDDLDRLSEVLGAMGVNAIVAANPILGLVTIATMAYAYWRHETVAGSEVVKGSSIAGVSALVFASMGLPVLVELVIVVVVAHQLRERVFEDKRFRTWIREHARRNRPSVDDLLAMIPESTPLAKRIRAITDLS